MPHFAYTAIDAGGRTVKSVMEADNEAIVLNKLREQSMQIVEVKKTKAKKVGGFGKAKMKPKSLVVFSRQFATMIDAGIPILRCMEILTSQTKDPALKPALESVTSDVKSGMTMHDSMAKHPGVFNNLYVNMIRAAEKIMTSTGYIIAPLILALTSASYSRNPDRRSRMTSRMPPSSAARIMFT